MKPEIKNFITERGVAATGVLFVADAVQRNQIVPVPPLIEVAVGAFVVGKAMDLVQKHTKK